MNATKETVRSRWVTTQELIDELRLNRQAIREFRLLGCLVPGTHFIKKTKGARSPLIWDVEAVTAALRAYSSSSALEVYD